MSKKKAARKADPEKAAAEQPAEAAGPVIQGPPVDIISDEDRAKADADVAEARKRIDASSPDVRSTPTPPAES